MARTIAKDHDTKRQQILAGAAQVFASEGFDRASVSNVAEVCAISKANIYHYYASKDDILFDILDTHLSSLRDEVLEKDNPDLAVEERFLNSLTTVLLAYHGADYEHQLQVNSLSQLPQDKQSILRGYQSELVAHLSGIIKMLCPKRFADDRVELHAITMSVFGMLNWFYMWNRRDDKQARIDYAKTVFDLMMKGIRSI